ncbi:DUF3488 and transglutaminase-like domain-containing protein [Actinocorallia sp. API 0066]|uniref:transglutaminase domain-containing protein n=1 Tax=Actinocorallia sp. API 0066 TaxID=2896846 RepID=UPI001E59D089|nr:transglutaminase domain-containing protein [Actinocorallia sp. API 0066]MCD0453327.1 DUF3488 and transglutaminase-like domain-containing protein [Actinocorallia sp. API 0066]
MTRRRAGTAWALLTGAACTAGLGFHSVFGLAHLWLPVVVVCVGTSAVVGLGRRRPWIALAGSAAVPLAVLCAVDGPPARIATAARDGWAGLLDTTLPVVADVTTLTVPLLVVWAGTAGAGLVAGWSDRPFPPLLPVLGVFAVAMGYGAADPGVNLTHAAALTAVAVAFTAVRARGAGNPWAVLAALAVVLPLAFLGARGAGDRDPHDFREGRALSLWVRDEVSPLSRVSEWLARPRELFTVEGARTGEPLRLMVFDGHDGLRWTPSAAFVRPGLRIPARVPVTGPSERVTVRFGETGGRWLPVPGWPDRITAPGARVDPVTGTLALTEPAAPGYVYEVWTSAPRRPDAAAVARLRALPLGPRRAGAALPPRLAELGALAARDARGAYGFAEKLAAVLSRECSADPRARPGHSLGRMAAFCTPGPDGVGTSEQFATAYALIARVWGLPVRVVLGFDPAPGGKALADVLPVRSDSVLVWPEVEFAGAGWVPFRLEPDSAGAGAEALPPDPAAPAPSPTPEKSDAPKPTPSPTMTPRPPKDFPVLDLVRNGGTSWGIVLLVVLIFLLVPLAYLTSALVLPVLARWRARAAGPPAARITAAWLYATRPVRARLGADARALTPTGTLRRLTARDTDPSPLVPLAELVDATLYLNHTPTDADAATAWRAATAFRARLPARLFLRRLTPRDHLFYALLTTRPLHRRRR